MSVDMNMMYMTGRIADVSSATATFIAVPTGGRLVRVNTVTEGAITVADSVLTVTVSATNSGATGALTAGTITITADGAAGDIDELICGTPIPPGGYVKVLSDGGGTDAQQTFVTIAVRR